MDDKGGFINITATPKGVAIYFIPIMLRGDEQMSDSECSDSPRKRCDRKLMRYPLVGLR
jgi:hypothetical protein